MEVRRNDHYPVRLVQRGLSHLLPLLVVRLRESWGSHEFGFGSQARSYFSDGVDDNSSVLLMGLVAKSDGDGGGASLPLVT